MFEVVGILVFVTIESFVFHHPNHESFRELSQKQILLVSHHIPFGYGEDFGFHPTQRIFSRHSVQTSDVIQLNGRVHFYFTHKESHVFRFSHDLLPWDWTNPYFSPVAFWCLPHSTSDDLESTSRDEVFQSWPLYYFPWSTLDDSWNPGSTERLPYVWRCLCTTWQQSSKIPWLQAHSWATSPSRLDRDTYSWTEWLDVRWDSHPLDWRENGATNWRVPHQRHPQSPFRQCFWSAPNLLHSSWWYWQSLANTSRRGPRIPRQTPWWQIRWG